MKIAVIGANGQLGTELCKVIPSSDLIPLNLPCADITNMPSIITAFSGARPDIIINTAAHVRVDDCEDQIDLAYKVNSLGARNIAVIAQSLGAKLVHLSTDYVFGGDRERKIPYNEFDNPYPISIYGKSKLAGEQQIQHLCNKYFIVRTSGLFGRAGSEGKGGNFVETILKMAKDRKELRIVSDQLFSPTYAVDLTKKIYELCATEFYGIYHITNSGACSWYEFTGEILELSGLKIKVTPISSSEFPQKATRPGFSVLDNYQLRLLQFEAMQSWQDALRRYLKDNRN